MKNNILKKATAIAMVPIIGLSASSCSKKVDEYINTAANYYSDTFIEDNEFEFSFEEVGENIPMYMDNNPLIFVARIDTWDSSMNWFIGYLTYDEKTDKVYFYDVEKNDKLDIAKFFTVEYDKVFIVADELGLPYDNHIPMKVIKEVIKSAKLSFSISTMVIIDPETGKEKTIPIHDLEFDVFKVIDNNKESTTKKLVKTK